MNNEDTIDTPDIYFAAALLCVGWKIDSVNRSNPRRLVFTMSGDNLEEYETSWVNKNFMVNAPDYRDAIQRMKTLVHS